MSPEIRIGGGCYRGQRISSSSGDYRPTTGIVKKSLFDILAESVEGSRFLDLFAGCGAVGLEALSRGAEYVCFVDNSISRCAILRKNLERLRAPQQTVDIISKDYVTALQLLSERSARFDFVYCDPPYEDTVPARVLGDIVAAQVLADDGLLVYESARRDVRRVVDSTPDMLYPVRERMFGSTALVFFRWRNRHSGHETNQQE
jgi:16S rRNA (guanine966-N2)-methyltransferase